MNFDTFRHYFSTVAHQMKENMNLPTDITEEALKLLQQMDSEKVQLTEFDKTTEFEIVSIMKAIRRKETRIIYGMTTIFIKALSIVIAQPLKIIFNRCKKVYFLRCSSLQARYRSIREEMKTIQPTTVQSPSCQPYQKY